MIKSGYIILFFLLLSSLYSLAQSTTNVHPEEPIYDYVNKRASFPGGDFARNEYLNKHIDFSQQALTKKKEGPYRLLKYTRRVSINR